MCKWKISFSKAPVSSKEFLDIQATLESGFTLKHVRYMIRTCSQMHRTDKYSQHRWIVKKTFSASLVKWLSVRFPTTVSGCRFESRCCHINVRYVACFEQRVPWHSANSSVWIQSESVRDMIRGFNYTYEIQQIIFKVIIYLRKDISCRLLIISFFLSKIYLLLTLRLLNPAVPSKSFQYWEVLLGGSTVYM